MTEGTLGPRTGRTDQVVQRVLDDLRRVFRRVETLSRRAERVTNLSSPQLWALKTLGETGAVDVATLARRMRLHPSTLAGVLERLAGKGLIEWRSARRSGGPPRASVTAEGRYIGTRAPAVAPQLLLQGLRRLSPEGLACVSEGIHRLVVILGAKQTPAHLLFSEEVNLRVVRRARRRKPPA